MAKIAILSSNTEKKF